MTNQISQLHHKSVLIVGFGQMGHAMQTLLKGKAPINIWRVTPWNLDLPPAVSKAAATAEFVMLCVPTIAVAATLAALQTRLNKRSVVLSIAKGLDEAGLTAADILQSHLGKRARWGVLGGPMIANELRAGGCGFAEFGGHGAESRHLVCRLFRDSQLHLVPNRNPHVVSWCGVLKNVYVPLFGLSDGLGWGDNLRGRLTCAALAEIDALVQRFCGVRNAANGIAGLADLVTTATSRSSHHRTLGLLVAHGQRLLPQAEGSHSLQVLMRRGSRPPPNEFPLLHVAAALVRRPQSARARLATWIETMG